MITIETNAKEINLTEEVTHVRFTAGYPYFWVRNDGESVVLISLSQNISEGTDGVISVPAGNADGTMHGYRQHNLYIKGSGKVMVMGTTSAHNPFKSVSKGGEFRGAGLEIKVVDTLPETGESKYLYLVPKSDLLSNDIYYEYVWTDGNWEKIGTTETSVTVDTALSETSENPVQNKVIAEALAGKADKSTVDSIIENGVPKLSAPRTINDTNFDGTADIRIKNAWNFGTAPIISSVVRARVLCKIPVSTNAINKGQLRQGISFLLWGGVNYGDALKGTYLVEFDNRNAVFNAAITRLSSFVNNDANFFYCGLPRKTQKNDT